jgi:hypothetical protein
MLKNGVSPDILFTVQFFLKSEVRIVAEGKVKFFREL